MRTPTSTHTIIEWENFYITLADGTRLAARAWLPEDATECPVPAILEYIPYRKRDGTKTRDEQMHPYWARYGYACVRVDMRGCVSRRAYCWMSICPRNWTMVWRS